MIFSYHQRTAHNFDVNMDHLVLLDLKALISGCSDLDQLCPKYENSHSYAVSVHASSCFYTQMGRGTYHRDDSMNPFHKLMKVIT